MMPRSNSCSALFALCFALSITSATRADTAPTGTTSASAPTEDLDEAAKDFATGKRLFEEKKYELARIKFQASYELSHKPDLLHNLSYVAEGLNRIQEAIDLEKRFLLEMKRFPTEYNLADQQQAEDRIAQLQTAAQRSSPIPLVPAPHPLRSRPPSGALALIGIGGGFLLVGIGCGIGALTTASRLNAGMVPRDEHQTTVDRGRALNTSAIVFDVVGGGVLAAGAIWAIVDRVKQRRR